MKILLSRSNKIGSLLIRLVTWSRFSHVGILTDDRKHVIEALMFKGVVKTPLKEFIERNDTVDEYEIQGSAKDAEWYVGFGYDHLALIGMLFRNRNWHDPTKWFCSELVAFISKMFNARFMSRVTPQHILMVATFIKRLKG